jgi:hypothetical protein
MQSYPLIACGILLVVVMPLLVLYLKGNWPLRKVIPALVIIPVLWYFTYVPSHELSHAAGLYLAAGKAIDYKLIPRFWLGEFRGGWITPSGMTQSWQQLMLSAFPYMLDIVCFVVAIFVFRRCSTRNLFLLALLSCFYASGLQLILYLNLLLAFLAGEVVCGTCNMVIYPNLNQSLCIFYFINNEPLC